MILFILLINDTAGCVIDEPSEESVSLVFAKLRSKFTGLLSLSVCVCVGCLGNLWV